MTRFEQQLIEDGYKCDWKPIGLEHIQNVFTKGSKEVVFGLNELKKPPTLISPRPFVNHWNNGIIRSQREDDVMNRALAKFTYKEIMNSIDNKTVLQLWQNNSQAITNHK